MQASISQSWTCSFVEYDTITAMNWEALGAIANLFAAIGVIATLIYLSIQIRQNTKAVRSSSIQNLVQSLSTTAQAAVENESMIPLLLKANTGDSALTEEERTRLHFWFVMTFRRFEGVYFQRDLGFVDAAVIEGFERSHIAIIASKTGQAWWTNSKEIFNSGFVSYVEGLLEKGTPKTLHPIFRID
jgi:hypothetical protein